MSSTLKKENYFHMERETFRATPGSGPRTSSGMVISRAGLSFSTFNLKTSRRMSTASLLKLQSSFIPFPDAPVNMIYEISTRGRREFLSWISPDPIPQEPGVRKLLPESLIFHCRPQDLDRYNIYVFRRDPGFEIIFWDSPRFYSLYAKNETEIPERLLSLIRRSGISESPRILSDVDFPIPRKEIKVDRTSPDWGYIFLPRHCRLKKRYSRFTESFRAREQRGRVKSWTLGLNLLIILMGLGVLLQLAFLREAGADKAKMSDSFTKTERVRSELWKTESQLRERRNRLSEYPDHLRYLKSFCSAMGDRAILTEYSIGKGKLESAGYTANSLILVKRLRQVKGFSGVRLRNHVIRDSKAEREKFDVEITLD